MVNKLKKLIVMAMALAISGSPIAFAQQTTLRLATVAPQKTIWQQQLDQFTADVASETQGRVKIDVFYNAQLGGEQIVLRQVMRGRIDMAMASVSSLADQLPDAYLVSMLFYYDNVAARSCILDKVRNDYRDLIAPLGLQFMDWTETGTGQLVADVPYLTPDSIKGKRLGVLGNPITNQFWESIGALPVMTPSTDAASNLATHLIDVYPTIPVFYVFAGVNKVAPVLSKIDYVMSPATILIDSKTWKKLSKEDRAGMERALARHPSTERSKAFYAFEETVLGMHQKSGGKVINTTAQQKELWRKDIDKYYSKVLGGVSAKGREFFGKLEAARKACAK